MLKVNYTSIPGERLNVTSSELCRTRDGGKTDIYIYDIRALITHNSFPYSNPVTSFLLWWYPWYEWQARPNVKNQIIIKSFQNN